MAFDLLILVFFASKMAFDLLKMVFYLLILVFFTSKMVFNLLILVFSASQTAFGFLKMLIYFFISVIRAFYDIYCTVAKAIGNLPKFAQAEQYGNFLR